MSAEAPKKRGRPRKVVADPKEDPKVIKEPGKSARSDAKKTMKKAIEGDVSSAKRKRVAKPAAEMEETSSGPKLEEEMPPTSAAEAQAKPSLLPPAYENSKILQKLAATSSKPSASPILPHIPRPTSPPPQLLNPPPLNITSSPILQQAAALSSNAKSTTSTKAATSSKPASTPKTTTSRKATTTPSAKAVSATATTTAKSVKPSASASNAPRPSSATTKAAAPNPPPPSRAPSRPPPTPQKPIPTTPTPKPPLPTLSELNSSAVAALSARPGPGSGAAATRAMPTPMDRRDPRYRQAFRRWMTIMVGMPIAIVTSYLLYERIVLGREVSSLSGYGEVEGVRRTLERARKAARDRFAGGAEGKGGSREDQQGESKGE